MSEDHEIKLEWFDVSNLDTIDSPAVVVDVDRVKANIAKMVAMVDGNADRLRPHVKTHKMPAVIELQLDAGIQKFKVATIAEAEMVAQAGGKDILLAHQPVGPRIQKLGVLATQFPEVSFAAIVDDAGVVEALAAHFGKLEKSLRLYVDIDCGMNRTGIKLGSKCDALIQSIHFSDCVSFAGLHVYDGHLHQPSLDDRQGKAGEIIVAVRAYAQQHPEIEIIGGGSPTFGIWAGQTNWQCSPGTPVFWDVGYASSYPDLNFQIAAALVTRVVSKPGTGKLCFDLGYKSVSSEMPLERRVIIPEITDAELVGHSEEHLVIATESADEIEVGKAFLAFPTHICPTIASHAIVHLAQWGNATGHHWDVTARDR